jgi:hypothetical protein
MINISSPLAGITNHHRYNTSENIYATQPYILRQVGEDTEPGERYEPQTILI